jgi:hypothetical protein
MDRLELPDEEWRRRLPAEVYRAARHRKLTQRVLRIPEPAFAR